MFILYYAAVYLFLLILQTNRDITVAIRKSENTVKYSSCFKWKSTISHIKVVRSSWDTYPELDISYLEYIYIVIVSDRVKA